MRRALLLVLLLATPAFAADFFRSYPSPDGNWRLVTVPARVNWTGYRHALGLRLVNRKGEARGEYDADARAFEIWWSPDSRKVAILSDISHYTFYGSVWQVGPRGWKQLRLPACLTDPKAIRALLPPSLPGDVAWRSIPQPVPIRWRNASDLEIGLDLTGWPRRDGKADYSRTIDASLRFVARFAPGRAEVVEARRLSCEVAPSS